MTSFDSAGPRPTGDSIPISQSTREPFSRVTYRALAAACVAALTLGGCTGGIDPGMAQILILAGGILVIPFVWRALKGSMEEREELRREYDGTRTGPADADGGANRPDDEDRGGDGRGDRDRGI